MGVQWRPPRLRGSRFWWGEAPDQHYHFNEGAGLLKPSMWLQHYARRAAVYCVNKAKRLLGQFKRSRSNQDVSDMADPRLGAHIGLAEPLEFTNASTFVHIVSHSGASPHQKCVPRKRGALHRLKLATVLLWRLAIKTAKMPAEMGLIGEA